MGKAAKRKAARRAQGPDPHLPVPGDLLPGTYDPRTGRASIPRRANFWRELGNRKIACDLCGGPGGEFFGRHEVRPAAADWLALLCSACRDRLAPAAPAVAESRAVEHMISEVLSAGRGRRSGA